MTELYLQFLLVLIVLFLLFSPLTYSLSKRSLDIVVSFTVLTLSSLFLIPIIILLRFTAEGEVFYFQKRIGFKNQPFYIWKFATMLKDSPNIGTGTITLKNDPRVTIIGKYLRKSKINELPQIINVLKGDMSLVGPRPLDDRGFRAYSSDIQNIIYNSKPGMTGIGSIFFRDEERIISESDLSPDKCYKEVIAPYKGELELWYSHRKSFYVDMVIIFLTAWVIIMPSLDLTTLFFRDLPKFDYGT
tara:strand:- start:121 stop:855 length:735 start_codon:yes stop_codon:yes gene_type:complete